MKLYPLLIASLFFIPSALAKSTIGYDHGFGTNYKQNTFTGSIDLDKENKWNGDVLLGNTTQTGDSPTKSRSFNAGASYSQDDAHEYHLALDTWNDTTNKVKYVGPSATFTYTSNQQEEKKTAPAKDDAKDDDAASEENFAITLGLDIYFYSATMDLNSSTGATATRREKALSTPTKAGVVRTTQTRPNVEIEKPFFDDFVTPSISYSYYRYSVPPENIENGLDKASARFNTTGPSSMVGGFLRQSYQASLAFHLLKDTDLTGTFGRQQSAVDKLWSSSASVTLTQMIGEHFKLKGACNQSMQSGTVSRNYVVGIAYYF